MNALYQHIGLSKQGYHQREKRCIAKHDVKEIVKSKVKETRKVHPRIGSRRLHKAAGIQEMGITRFEEMMSKEGLTMAPKRKWIRGTDSRGKKHIYPNLTNGLKLQNINELVVGDLTYLINNSGTYYLTFLTDVYSSRIVGWEGAEDKGSEHAGKALEKMVDLRGEEKLKGMIHHTDRGSEYRSDEYIGCLLKMEIQISMAKTCMENGYAERRNGIIKNDYLEFMSCGNIKELRRALDEAVYRYNHLLHQERLGNRTPVEYEAWLQTVPLDQRPVLELYDFKKTTDIKRKL